MPVVVDLSGEASHLRGICIRCRGACSADYDPAIAASTPAHMRARAATQPRQKVEPRPTRSAPCAPAATVCRGKCRRCTMVAPM